MRSHTRANSQARSRRSWLLPRLVPARGAPRARPGSTRRGVPKERRALREGSAWSLGDTWRPSRSRGSCAAISRLDPRVRSASSRGLGVRPESGSWRPFPPPASSSVHGAGTRPILAPQLASRHQRASRGEGSAGARGQPLRGKGNHATRSARRTVNPAGLGHLAELGPQSARSSVAARSNRRCSERSPTRSIWISRSVKRQTPPARSNRSR